MDTLVYHPTVAHYIRFVNTTVGRDKLLRFIQYLSRFLSFYLLRKGYSAKSLLPFNVIKSQFGLTRKLMRVGKNVEHLKEAGRVSSAKSMDPVLRYCAVGRQLGYFTYLTLDSIHYLDAAKIYPMEKATSQRIVKTAQKAWLTGIFLNILSSGYSLYHLGLKREKANKLLGEGKVEEKRIEKEAYETRMQLLCDLCDFVIPASALGLVTVDEGVVGMAGTISSLIGLRGVWRKTAGGA